MRDRGEEQDEVRHDGKWKPDEVEPSRPWQEVWIVFSYGEFYAKE